MRGLLREVLSPAVWLVTLYVAWTFHKELAGAFVHWIASDSFLRKELTDELARWIMSPNPQTVTAFLILILGVLILRAIIGSLLSIVNE